MVLLMHLAANVTKQLTVMHNILEINLLFKHDLSMGGRVSQLQCFEEIHPVWHHNCYFGQCFSLLQQVQTSILVNGQKALVPVSVRTTVNVAPAWSSFDYYITSSSCGDETTDVSGSEVFWMQGRQWLPYFQRCPTITLGDLMNPKPVAWLDLRGDRSLVGIFPPFSMSSGHFPFTTYLGKHCIPTQLIWGELIAFRFSECPSELLWLPGTSCSPWTLSTQFF